MSWCCEPAGLFDVQLKLPRASVAPGMHTGVAGAQLPQRKHEEEEDGWATRRADFFASSRAGASRRQWSLCGHHRCAAVCSLSHDSVPGAHGPCSRRILHVRVYSASGMQRPVRFRACDRVSVRILCAFRPGQLLVVVANFETLTSFPTLPFKLSLNSTLAAECCVQPRRTIFGIFSDFGLTGCTQMMPPLASSSSVQAHPGRSDHLSEPYNALVSRDTEISTCP